MYVSDLYPIVRDLTNSMRSGDWTLYLSAVERATHYFFYLAEQTIVAGHQRFYKTAIN